MEINSVGAKPFDFSAVNDAKADKEENKLSIQNQAAQKEDEPKEVQALTEKEEQEQPGIVAKAQLTGLNEEDKGGVLDLLG